VTGRFAPSPTGSLHLGNLRTALAAWLFARSQGGRFLLRIEDLDPERSRAEHERGQLEHLRMLGLDWDGEPVRQSERGALYREMFAELQGAGRVYPCWCTRAEIRRAASAPHGEEVRSDRYPGTCRSLTAAQRSAYERARGAPSAWRLDAGGERVELVDGLHGGVELEVDDFVLWRGRAGADGVAAYNLAVVVDDAAQGVEQVVRGDDLLAGTPRQLLLVRLLGLNEPDYAHVPLVLGPDGRRLAKRDGAVTLAERLRLGEDIEAIVGWMAAGLGLAEVGERLSATRVLARFDPARVSRIATVFDPSDGLTLG
jgi:glutamyl-tRNA synthetase